ncbi:hypothetical protein GKZ75_02615 [Kocuria indica]|uniref:Uncharacterized protein n=1 Tax=Kocuria marina subsp. indica TaxID=1049583 RepID=A0A6N9QWX4_9MICC|nr:MULTISPECIES: hypothetical protein [Kocuria]MCT1615368.1 hypothetical protein [Kocuria marina]NDO77157.1 hypothetical protein [Kocuria indica]
MTALHPPVTAHGGDTSLRVDPRGAEEYTGSVVQWPHRGPIFPPNAHARAVDAVRIGP